MLILLSPHLPLGIMGDNLPCWQGRQAGRSGRDVSPDKSAEGDWVMSVDRISFFNKGVFRPIKKRRSIYRSGVFFIQRDLAAFRAISERRFLAVRAAACFLASISAAAGNLFIASINVS
jgi:hypothetical protein